MLNIAKKLTFMEYYQLNICGLVIDENSIY